MIDNCVVGTSMYYCGRFMACNTCTSVIRTLPFKPGDGGSSLVQGKIFLD